MNAIIGIFQVASLLELTLIMFKNHKQQQMIRKNLYPSSVEEEDQDSESRGIFVTYLLAMISSLGVIAYVVFLQFELFPVVTDHNIVYYEFSLIVIYSLLSLALTVITILLVIYTSKVSKRSLSRESRLLCIFFVVFSVAYLSRIVVYSYNAFVDYHTFAIFVTETVMPSVWEVTPIAILLKFHRQNFRPYQSRLVIRQRINHLNTSQQANSNIHISGAKMSGQALSD